MIATDTRKPLDPTVGEMSNEELIKEFVSRAKTAKPRLTQARAAKLVGVGQTTVSEWWRGVYRDVRPETRDQLERAVRHARETGSLDIESRIDDHSGTEQPESSDPPTLSALGGHYFFLFNWMFAQMKREELKRATRERLVDSSISEESNRDPTDTDRHEAYYLAELQRIAESKDPESIKTLHRDSVASSIRAIAGLVEARGREAADRAAEIRAQALIKAEANDERRMKILGEDYREDAPIVPEEPTEAGGDEAMTGTR